MLHACFGVQSVAEERDPHQSGRAKWDTPTDDGDLNVPGPGIKSFIWRGLPRLAPCEDGEDTLADVLAAAVGGFPGQCVGKIQTITRGFDGSQKEHVVLVKSNGFPTYILVVTVTRITDGKTQLYPTPTEGEHHGEED